MDEGRTTMQSSTWNNTNQHWVPRFILKGFGTKGNSGKVYKLDKRTGEIKVRNVDEVASKPHLLTERDDWYMKRIENASANAVGKIRKGNDIEHLLTKEVLALESLVRAMERIDPYCGSNGLETRKVVVDSFMQIVNEAAMHHGQMLDEADLRKFIDDHLEHEALSGYRQGPPDSAFPMWPRSHRAPDGEYLVIGDSPVTSIRSADGLLAQLILPIGSKYVYTLTADNFREQVPMIGQSATLTNEAVRSLNAHYYLRQPGQYLYSRDENTLEQCKLQPPISAIQESPKSDYYVDLMDKLIVLSLRSICFESDLVENLMKYPVHHFMMRARAHQALSQSESQDVARS